MSPIFILLLALAVVIGGILLFRLHAFLILIVGALVVAALTPAASVRRFELRKDEVRIESIGSNGLAATVRDRKRLSTGVTVGHAYRLVPGQEPKRIARLEVTVFPASNLGDRRVEALATEVTDGEALKPGDHVLSATTIAAASKIAASSVGQRVAEGFGRTALDIGILIAMASILGTCLMAARGAERIVLSLQRLFGEGRTPLAFLGSGFLLGIPMFAEAVFYLLLPLAKAMWVKSRRHYVLYVLAIVAGATMTHSLVPPTPGPLFAANELGVGLSTMMIQGSTVVALAAVAGFAYAIWADRRWSIPMRGGDVSVVALGAGALPADEGQGHSKPSRLPALLPSLLPILLPVVLISAASLVDSEPGLELPSRLKAAIAVVGDKNLALTFSAGLAMLLLAFQRGGALDDVRRSIRSAIVEAGEIILVIGAGGALGQTLRQAGMAELASAAVPEWKLALLPVAWAITAVIRVAQGSATVAMITAVGILAPIVASADLGYHPVYVAVAIGCGSKIGMWMNDSGFWVISKMSGLTEAETLKTASVMVFIEGCVGLVVTMFLAAVWR